MKTEKSLEGISGWLILVAIGIIFGPIRMIAQMATTYMPLIKSEEWGMLTNPESEVYNSLWTVIVYGEIFINSAILITSIYMAYTFFSKKSFFPRLFIGLSVFTFLFILTDAYSVKLVLPDEPVFDPDTTKELMRSAFAVFVWTPYMLVSKRVKATFVK